MKQLTKELEETKCTTGSPMKSAATSHPGENSKTSNTFGDASVKLKELERELDNKDTLMKDLVQSLEEARASLAKEKESCSKGAQEIRKEKSEVLEKLVKMEHQCSALQEQVNYVTLNTLNNLLNSPSPIKASYLINAPYVDLYLKSPLTNPPCPVNSLDVEKLLHFLLLC